MPAGTCFTCHHNVDEADVVFVRLSDGTRLESIRVLSDPLTDLAVVQIPMVEGLSVATMANSDEVQVGDWVVAIGNPYGLGLSVNARDC